MKYSLRNNWFSKDILWVKISYFKSKQFLRFEPVIYVIFGIHALVVKPHKNYG